MRTKAQQKFTKTSAKQTYNYIKKYSPFIADMCSNLTQKAMANGQKTISISKIKRTKDFHEKI